MPHRLVAWVSFEPSPDDGRPKTAAWVNVGRGDAMAQIIVWDAGECELASGSPASSPEAEFRQLDTEQDLGSAIDRLLAKL